MFVKAANQTCDTCLYCQKRKKEKHYNIPERYWGEHWGRDRGNWYATVEEVLECRCMPEPVDKQPNDWCGQWRIKS